MIGHKQLWLDKYIKYYQNMKKQMKEEIINKIVQKLLDKKPDDLNIAVVTEEFPNLLFYVKPYSVYDDYVDKKQEYNISDNCIKISIVPNDRAAYSVIEDSPCVFFDIDNNKFINPVEAVFRYSLVESIHYLNGKNGGITPVKTMADYHKDMHSFYSAME